MSAFHTTQATLQRTNVYVREPILLSLRRFRNASAAFVRCVACVAWVKKGTWGPPCVAYVRLGGNETPLSDTPLSLSSSSSRTLLGLQSLVAVRLQHMHKLSLHTTQKSIHRQSHTFLDCAVGTTDRLSSVSLLMGVESKSGAADARAVVTWPGAEVAARLNPLPDCSFVFQSFDSWVFELSQSHTHTHTHHSPDSRLTASNYRTMEHLFPRTFAPGILHVKLPDACVGCLTAICYICTTSEARISTVR